MAREVAPLQAAHLTYDSSAASACIARVSAAYTDAKVTNDEQKALRDACALVFSGPGDKNRPCDVNSDCTQGQGLRCVVHFSASLEDAGESLGTCQVPVSTSPGSSCSLPDAQCAEGYHCGVSSHCDQDEPLDAPCSSEDPCSEGLQCASAHAGESSCVEKPGVGTTCSVDSDCASGYCAEGVNLCASSYQLSPSEPFCAALHD
jgi:hypothetical protein